DRGRALVPAPNPAAPRAVRLAPGSGAGRARRPRSPSPTLLPRKQRPHEWWSSSVPILMRNDRVPRVGRYTDRRPEAEAMTIRTSFVLAAIIGALTSLQAQAPKPKHINRAIELLEAGQPVYYTGSHSGTEGTFEAGKADAHTYADYISYDMEHAPFDVKGLADYMKGLVAGGPTNSGHPTPAVIVNVP